MKTVKTKQAESANGYQGRSGRHIPSYAMESIARGVQIRLDERTNFSRRVTDETVNTARALGVSNSIIERWAAERLNRLAQETERLRGIRALLDRSSRHFPDWMTRAKV
jgi:hypothetical protein